MNARESLTTMFSLVAARIDSTSPGVRLVGFSGPLGGEGATTVAMGTAMALTALQTESILLVDANWHDPALTASARMSSPGLAACLTGSPLSEAVRPTKNPNLYLLPAGGGEIEPPLGELHALLNEAGTRFRYVLVDLPPVLVSPALVMSWSGLLDQLFLVVRSGSGRARPLRRAIEALAPISQPAMILNVASREKVGGKSRRGSTKDETALSRPVTAHS